MTNLVTGEEIRAAFRHWLEAYTGKPYRELLYNDWDAGRRSFLKMVALPQLSHDRWYVDDRSAALIRGMCGPHGYAYCKMIMLQNETSIEESK